MLNGNASRQDVMPREDRPTMVFHAPYPMEANPGGASRLRPLRMRQAFADLGYRVIEVTGPPRQRRRSLRSLRRYLRAGGRVDFLYSESSTMPNALATSVRRGGAPFLEAALWLACRRRRIPVGVFYRDVYWRFTRFRGRAARWWTALLQVLYRFDLVAYALGRCHIFLPSVEMAPVLGVPRACSYSALPPGADVKETPAPADLSLLYVGGLGGHYNLEQFVGAVARAEGVPLTLCVPLQHWERVSDAYGTLLGDGTRVVHASGEALDQLYEDSSVGVLFLEPTDYLDFAVPVKLFEYIGRGRPVIAAEGTLAGDLVARSGAGWTVPYDEGALVELLARLRSEPDEIRRRAGVAREIRGDHTWSARAAEAARVLTRAGADSFPA